MQWGNAGAIAGLTVLLMTSAEATPLVDDAIDEIETQDTWVETADALAGPVELGQATEIATDGKQENPDGETDEDEENQTREANETDVDAEAEGTLRIVVTAEKTPEPVQDIPISITVLDQQELEDAAIDDFEDIARNTPNFSVFDGSGSRYFYNYSIRGLGSNNFLSRDAVSFYVDDVPYDYGGFIGLDLYDLERVEILRGPQSTLYGRSAFSGVVNVVTQPPTNDYEFGTTVQYGNFDDFEVQGNVSGPLIDDELFFRLSGSYDSRDGYFNNTFLNEDFASSSSGNGRLQLRWLPQEDWDITLSGAFSAISEDGVPIVPIDGDPFTVGLNAGGFAELNTNSQSLRIAYTQPDFRVTSVSARRYSRANQAADFDGSSVDLGLFSSDFDSTVFTQEVRVQSPENADRWQWTIGGYFESRQFNTQNDGLNFGADALGVFGLPPESSNLRSSDSNERFWAIFSQASYPLTESLTLTAGLRYENFSSTLNNLTQRLAIPGLPAQTLASFDNVNTNGGVWLPRLAAEYRFNPDVMVYGSIARGYRPGGVNYRASNLATLTFDPEQGWNFELGAKSTWFDDRLGVNLSVFHNIVDNYQVQIPGPLITVNEIANADASITGVELEVRATPLEGLDIIAGFGYLDAEFSDFTNPFNGDNFTGNRLPLAPEFTYNLAVQYRSAIGLLGRVELQGTGFTAFDESNTFSQGAYAVVNARLGYEFDNTGIYFSANNIFDTRYLTQGADGFGGGQIGQYGSPATFGFQIRSRF